MFAFFKRRAVLTVIGFVLLAIVIFLAGPLVSFAGYFPLGTFTAQAILFALVVLAWAAWQLFTIAKAHAASGRLMAAVVKQDAESPRPSAETQQLREKFEEAVALLKKKGGRAQSLYDLPWYVIIGAPGSGKTTALVNSGLHFPVEQRNGRALKGVGGTRNCDWWFSDEAVLLDTAGRYTTQDSDAASDSSAWTEFLSLLKKYRRRRPINGVILTVSAQDLAGFGRKGWEEYVASARRRLEELNHELRIHLPVYVTVTKCDLVPGFTEYFSDLTREGRTQVWGVTFPYEPAKADAAADLFPDEFDALVTRLNERLYLRLDAEQDQVKRAKVFGFPQQVGALRESLTGFVTDVFKSTRFDRQVLLRGVYFTSGTQWGTPLDGLIGVLASQALAPQQAISALAGQGKAYFIERLLKNVIIGESGLAGTNWRVELQKGAAQLAAYATIAAVAVLAVLALVWSYSRNQAYLSAVGVDAERVRAVAPIGASAPLDAIGPRLDAVGRVVESAARFESSIPWAMRWGLYQGHALSKQAGDAYQRELQVALLPRLMARIEQRLNDVATEPDVLYEYLKGYLILTEPGHWDPDHVQALAEVELGQQFTAQPELAASLLKHVQAMLAAGPLTVGAGNQDLITRARSSLRNASIERLVYSRVRANYDADKRNVRIDTAAGVGADRVFRFKNGRPLSTPIPALYTPDVFREVVEQGIATGARQVTDEQWVWGERGQPRTESNTLTRDVITLYEDDYIRTWQGILDGIEVIPIHGPDQAADVSSRLGGQGSPLRGLLQVVDANTYLEKPAAPPPPGGVIPTVKDLAQTTAERLRGRVPALGRPPVVPTAVPGARITKHFEDVHKLVAGSPGSAPIDRTVGSLRELGALLTSTGPEKVGGVSPVENPARTNAVLESLRSDAEVLPAPVGALVKAVQESSGDAISGGIRNELSSRYQQEVGAACRETVSGNYPFVPNSRTDAPAGDVARLFGDGGVFDKFFQANLVQLVDATRDPWRWKTDGNDRAVGGSAAMLRQFQAARRIKDVLFPPGGAGSALSFSLTPTGLDRTATRFTLQVDGQTLVYRHDPQTPTTVTWSPRTSVLASVAVEDGSSNRPGFEARGPWALFRLIDQAQVEAQGAGRATLTFKLGAHEARVLVEPQNARNPVTSRNLLQFQCEI